MIISTVKVSIVDKSGENYSLTCKINFQFGSIFGLKFSKDVDQIIGKSGLRKK